MIWDEKKNAWLKKHRGVSFDKIAPLILDRKYLAILENPARQDQFIFVIFFQNYTYVVPFVIDDQTQIVLKTVYPSRKFNKIYGGK